MITEETNIKQEEDLLDQLTEASSPPMKLPLGYDSNAKKLVMAISNPPMPIICEATDIVETKRVENSISNLVEANTFLINNFCSTTLKEKIRSNDEDIKLYDDLVSLIKGQICISPDVTHLLATYILLSFLYPIFPSIPYLYVGGPPASGKSTVAQLVSKLAFNGVHLVGPTLTAVRNLSHQTRGLISLDDSEFLSRDDTQTQDYRSKLNSSYSCSATTCVSGRNGKVETYFIGGPKIFNSIKGLEGVLSTRSLYISMTKADKNFRKDKTLNDYLDLVIKLRARCMAWALKNHRKVSVLFESISCPANREHELTSPLIAIAMFFDQLIPLEKSREYSLISAFKKSDEAKKVKTGFDVLLVKTLYEIWIEQNYPNPFYIFNDEIKNEMRGVIDENIPQSNHILQTKIGETVKVLDLVKSESRLRINGGPLKGTRYEIANELLENQFKKLFPELYIPRSGEGVSQKGRKILKTKNDGTPTNIIATEEVALTSIKQIENLLF